MASFIEHITQAKNNLTFLGLVNRDQISYWDWQTTVSFYISVHLVNAHVVAKANQHYRSHEAVNNAINPFNHLSLSKLPENVYTAYVNLQMLSRRSRYLISDKMNDHSGQAFFTSDKHFSRAVRNLDTLLKYITEEYATEATCNFNVLTIRCNRLINDPLLFFNIESYSF